MQTSGNRSSFYRPVGYWTSRVAGAGVVVGLFLAAGFVGTSCSPGTLDPSILDGAPPPTNTGGTGGGGGSPGTGGGSGGSPAGTGGGGGGAISAATKVANCAKFTTLGEADAFLKMRCGSSNAFMGVSCHGSGAVWTDMTQGDMWSVFTGAKGTTKVDCAGSKLIDSANWMNSMLVVKTSQAMPKCPGSGAPGGDLMPAKSIDSQAMALSTDEVTCFQEYAKAAAGAQ